MKIAISGKGGVGKTTLAALLAHIYAESGQQVIAIDADPLTNLASALGFPGELADSIVPISQMAELIEERTGARPGIPGAFFRLNPSVDDIPDRFSAVQCGVRLLRLGAVKAGGAGCMCAEHALVRALVNHLVLGRREVVILDMEAGVEHLGRATAQGVDAFLVVADPSRRSLAAAASIRDLAAEIGVHHIRLVGNKVREEIDRAFIAANAPAGTPVIGYLSDSPALVQAGMRELGVCEVAPELVEEARAIAMCLGHLAHSGRDKAPHG